MYTGWSALRSVVLCLLCTLGCATACDCNEQDLHSNLITYTKYMDMLNECFDNCQTRDYKVQVCAFIREHMQTVKECANVAKEGKTICEYCWPEDKLKASDPPPTPKPPPKKLIVDSTQPENPDATAKPKSYFNMIIAAAVDNFITEFFSDVFTWIFGMFTEMYKIFAHFVFPFFLACLSITVAFAKLWMPGLAHVTPYCPQIVMTGWWVFALYQFWFFCCYDYLNTALFCLTWGVCWGRFDKAVTANKMQISNNTNNTYTGNVMQITVTDGRQLSTLMPHLFQSCGLMSQNMPQLQAGSSTNPRAPQITDAPVEQVEPSRVIRSVKQNPPVDTVRAMTPLVTKASGKKDTAVPAAPPSAAAPATPVVVSQHPPAGEPLTPRNIFDTVCGFVKRVYVKPEQGVKRGRDADETTKYQRPDKKQKCTVAELKNMLDNAGIKYLKSAKKADLMESAQKAGLL